MTSPLQPPQPSSPVTMAADDQRWVPVVTAMAVIGTGGAVVALALGSVILGFVLVLISAVGAAVVTPILLINRRWHRPELTFPGGFLELGSQTTVRFARRPKSQIDLPNGDVELELICEERATYTVGTTTRTDTSKVVERTFTGRGGGTTAGFVADIALEVPVDAGAPTMDLGHNEVRWTISATVRAKGIPTRSSRFTVMVAPVLASSVIDRLGDR